MCLLALENGDDTLEVGHQIMTTAAPSKPKELQQLSTCSSGEVDFSMEVQGATKR